MDEEIRQAQEAISSGVDRDAVAKMFKERTGQDLPSPAPIVGQMKPVASQSAAAIQPPEIPKMKSDAASWPAGSPKNPTGKSERDPWAQAAIGTLNPVNLGLTAASMAVPGSGAIGRTLISGATAGMMGGTSAAMEAPEGQRFAAFGEGFKRALPVGLAVPTVLESTVGPGVALAGPAKVAAADMGADITSLREQANQAQKGIKSAADQARQAAEDRFAMRTGQYGTPGGLSAAEQGFGVGAVAPALQAGATTEAERLAAEQAGKAGITTAGKIRDITGYTEPVDVMKGQVKQAKQLIGETRYGPLEGPVDDPELMAFIQAPEFRRDLMAVAPDVAAGKRPPEFSELQDLRNRWRSKGNFQDKQAAQQLTGLMEKGRPGLTETADQPYAQFSEIGRAQTAATRAGSWDAAKIREFQSTLSDPAKQAFNETYVENNLTQKLLRKENGSPTMNSALQGGPQMDERLQAVLSPDQFDQIKQAVADHNSALRQIEAQKNVALAQLESSRTAGISALEGQRASDLSGINAGESAQNDAMDRARKRIDLLNQEQQAIQAQASQTANRIRGFLKWGATAAGAGAAGGMVLRELGGGR